MNIGDKVIPKTPSGLWLADVPTNGEYNQITKDVCVFTGIGTVIDVFDCVIDYDEWDRQKDDDDVKYNIGKVEYRSCLVQFEGGQGWAGSGALKLNLESKMNERIQELAEQAGYKPLPGFDFANSLEETYLKKFAELIINKCAMIGNYAYDGGEYPGRMIKEYFGVE